MEEKKLHEGFHFFGFLFSASAYLGIFSLVLLPLFSLVVWLTRGREFAMLAGPSDQCRLIGPEDLHTLLSVYSF